MTVQRLALHARDGYFFKDGRGWETSTLNRAQGFDWPFPPTVLGALRGAVGRALEDARGGRPFQRDEWVTHTREVTLGRMFPLRRKGLAAWSRADRMWPVPADARFVEGSDLVERLEPQPLPHGVRTLGLDGTPADDGLLWALAHGDTKSLPPPRWWTEAEFAAWLAGKAVKRTTERRAQPVRTDVHLAIDPDTFTARESMLYSTEIVESLDAGGLEWGLAAEVEGGPEGSRVNLADAVFVLGGNARVALAEKVTDALWEPVFAGAETRGLRLVAVTPCHFAGGWLPDGFARCGGRITGELPGLAGELVLRAALVPRAVHWSGWDMQRRGPRETTRLVPAGAVYYVERASGDPFTAAEVRAVWETRWGRDTGLGFGRVVAGIWNR